MLLRLSEKKNNCEKKSRGARYKLRNEIKKKWEVQILMYKLPTVKEKAELWIKNS